MITHIHKQQLPFADRVQMQRSVSALYAAAEKDPALAASPGFMGVLRHIEAYLVSANARAAEAERAAEAARIAEEAAAQKAREDKVSKIASQTPHTNAEYYKKMSDLSSASTQAANKGKPPVGEPGVDSISSYYNNLNKNVPKVEKPKKKVPIIHPRTGHVTGYRYE